MPDGFEVMDRARWQEFGHSPARLSMGDLGPDLVPPMPPGVDVSREEIEEIYVPLSRVLASAADGDRPLMIGVAGGVAVGKSTTAAILATLYGSEPGAPEVVVISTDSFLFPNRELEARGLMDRKGFPETYDHQSMVEALAAVSSGARDVSIPVYSHEEYDIVPGKAIVIGAPEIVIVEGLIVLQDPPGATGDGASGAVDLFDTSLYIDAAEADARGWYRERLAGLRAQGADGRRDGVAGDGDGVTGEGGTGNGTPFVAWLRSLSEEGFAAVVDGAWAGINAVNVREHVAPTRPRARVILEVDGRHRVERVLLRRP